MGHSTWVMSDPCRRPSKRNCCVSHKIDTFIAIYARYVPGHAYCSPHGNGDIILAVYLLERISSDGDERVWLKVCTRPEVCRGHCVSPFGGDRARGPARGAENFVFLGRQ